MRWRRPARAVPAADGGALLLDLVASVLASGAGPARALDVVADALDAGGDPAAAGLRAVRHRLDAPGPAPAGAAGEAVRGLESALRLAGAAGVPPAGLVRAAAADLRRRRRAAQSRSAARLGVLLVLPGGLCLLPAFMALGVAPLVIDLVLGAV